MTMRQEHGTTSTPAMGAEAVFDLLRTIDLQAQMVQLREDIASDRLGNQAQAAYKRIKLAEAFLESGNRPEWMVMTVLPVLPRTCVRWCRWMAAASRPPISTTCTVASSTATNRLRPPARAQRAGHHRAQRKAHAAGVVDALMDNGRRGRANHRHQQSARSSPWPT